MIKNKHLKIFQSKEKPEDPKRARVEIKTEKVSHQSVIEYLKDVSDPEEQLVYLVEILELTEDDISNRTQIAHHIQVRKLFKIRIYAQNSSFFEFKHSAKKREIHSHRKKYFVKSTR